MYRTYYIILQKTYRGKIFMQRLTKEETTLLRNVCQKNEVDSNHLRILLMIEREYSFKSTSRSQACRNEILKNIEVWTKS